MADKAESDLLDKVCKSVQDCLSSTPVVILGSGYSCGYGIPGMKELARFLQTEVPKGISAQELKEWSVIEGRLSEISIEVLLHEHALSSNLSDHVVRKTWECLIQNDKQLLLRIIEEGLELSLSTLYRYLFNSTHQRISVVTTNYDCLAEYAAEAAGFAWATGFGHGYVGRKHNNSALTIYKGTTAMRMVDVLKVHGSLNWFRSNDGAASCLPSAFKIPVGYSPVIVTPGINKYRRTDLPPIK